MDLSRYSSFSFEDEDAWKDFLLANSLSHTEYTDELARQGKSPLSYPVMDFDDSPEGHDDWLRMHQLLHVGINNLLGIASTPNLDDVDLTDATQFASWLTQHEQEHTVIDQTLGL
jgi:hypothetical protein